MLGLPSDINALIYSKCSLNDLAKFSICSKRHNKSVSESPLWRAIFSTTPFAQAIPYFSDGTDWKSQVRKFALLELDKDPYHGEFTGKQALNEIEGVFEKIKMTTCPAKTLPEIVDQKYFLKIELFQRIVKFVKSHCLECEETKALKDFNNLDKTTEVNIVVGTFKDESIILSTTGKAVTIGINTKMTIILTRLWRGYDNMLYSENSKDLSPKLSKNSHLSCVLTGFLHEHIKEKMQMAVEVFLRDPFSTFLSFTGCTSGADRGGALEEGGYLSMHKHPNKPEHETQLFTSQGPVITHFNGEAKTWEEIINEKPLLEGSWPVIPKFFKTDLSSRID